MRPPPGARRARAGSWPTKRGAAWARLAATLYERIEQRLTHLSPGDGDRIAITLDDRAAPAPDTNGDDQDGDASVQSA
ncbi:hypothetical protein AB0C52_23655 [Streptomyces sp. NPDC048717]|uniref:hypothetical protein n=1 Tax=Streptomyces sp. NPDC048717 TaxID=3154928 RepID=UPI0034278F00